jgi:hypothetical protein
MFTSTNTIGSMRSQPPKKSQEPPSKKETPSLETNAKFPKTEGWLTRNEASDMLRCSPQTLKNYESRDMLHPVYAQRKDRSDTERLMLVYNPKELADLPSRNPGGQPRIQMREPGELAARAFEMFRDGWALDEIVIELRETPDKIEQLHERWLDQTQARYVITPEAKKALEGTVGTFTNVAELLELITKKLASA